MRLGRYLLAGSLAVASATAFAAPAPKARARKPAPPRYARLAVLPAEIRLEGPNARQQVVIMATLPDGSRMDVTPQARLTSSAPKVARVDGPRVTAQADGTAKLVARLGKLATSAVIAAKGTAQPVSYSFANDVVPVLARLGCSSGSCHGANSGKGGFKLSLRGYAPELDFLWITRQYSGRRISREAPERSLLLRKPLMETPHGGGRALQKGSPEYYTLLGWLLQGAPGPDPKEPQVTALEALPGDRTYRPGQKQRVVVRARYADGRTRDVTDRAVFGSTDAAVAEVSAEGEITAQNPGATAVQAKYMDQLAVLRVTVPYPQKISAAAFPKPANFVDEAVYRKLRELNLEPSGPCTDEEFLRRAYVDALGTLPTPEETRAFLESKDPERRSKLIDAVLQRPEYGAIWALKLADVFMVRREHMLRKNTIAFTQWLAEQFRDNRPWDQLVTDLVTATGSPEERPETLWWASRQMVRPNGRGWVRHYELTGEIVAQVFLGQRIQCAKCHNHPTEKSTQDDYYRFAALFAQVNGDGRADPIPERFLANDPGEVRHPRTGEVVTPQPLDRADLKLEKGEDRRLKFAHWMTEGPGRDGFAKNAVNRVWARLFGTGIVSPVDDLRSTNPPRNPELLDALAKELVARRYDLKHLMGVVMRSNTYQASSLATPKNRIDTQFFSHYPVRRLQGEELLDAIAQVTGVPDRYHTYPIGTRAIELTDPELTSLSLDTFGRPNRTTPCECDRSMAPSMSQALDLFNGEGLQSKLKNPEGVVALLVKSGKSDAEMIEELFLRAFSRRPAPAELQATLKAVAQAPSKDEAMQDVLWALINSKEFMFNH